jgi:MFS family permease
VSPQKRTRCIAYFNVFNGLALSTGALLGGFLLQCLPPFFGYKILTLVALSSILRLIIGIIMPLRLKEVRPVEKIDNNSLFFSVLGIKPVLGIE